MILDTKAICCIEKKSILSFSNGNVDINTINYYLNGNIKSKMFFRAYNSVNEQDYINKNKKFIDCLQYVYFHNENGPAVTEYFFSGHIHQEKYFIKNKLHNVNGPADILYKNSPKKTILEKKYFYEGIFLPDIKNNSDLYRHIKLVNII